MTDIFDFIFEVFMWGASGSFILGTLTLIYYYIQMKLTTYSEIELYLLAKRSYCIRFLKWLYKL